MLWNDLVFYCIHNYPSYFGQIPSRISPKMLEKRYNTQYNWNPERNIDAKLVYGADHEIDYSNYKDDWSGLYENHSEFINSQYFDFQFRPKEKLYSTIGFRRDDHSIAGDHATGRATIAYKLNNLSKIK